MTWFRRNRYSMVWCVAGGLFILFCALAAGNVFAAGTANGEIEKRPAPVFRRVCLAGANAGVNCKQDSECPGSSCTGRNVFNLTVAVLYDAPAADLTAIRDLITATSATIFDVTDGQAEIGTATIHNNALTSNHADVVIHPSTNDTWWQALSGFYRDGGFAEVSINRITNPANQGHMLGHEFSHLVFDAKDEYENRQPNCGNVVGACRAGANAGNDCAVDANCPGSSCNMEVGNCPDPAANDGTSLMDGNGTEFCWGQGDPSNLTDLTGGNHDPTNETEQSSCRDNRSCWDQVVWSWPTTFLKPSGAPNPAAGGATVNAAKFVTTSDEVRVVLVLDESGSMSLESPARIERLRVAARDFVATAEDDTEIGVISYSTNADTASGHASVAIAKLSTNRAACEGAVSGLAPNGWTNIGDGLQKAKDLIDAVGVTANTYIVLMTDGLNNRPSPQATADAHLQAKVADLLAAGIPVYITCTGGDFGLESQCAEIGTGTGGFYSDSAKAAEIPENFVDFHERIAGRQGIDSLYGNLAKKVSPKDFLVDKGSESVSFSLLWQNPEGSAVMTLRDPGGRVYRSRSIPQGRYLRVKNPRPGMWRMTITARGNIASPFVARAYTHNRINNFIVSLRQRRIAAGEPIYVHAAAKSLGGTVTKPGARIIALVTLPDGSRDRVELADDGRAGRHGDDLAGDGVFTGVFRRTTQQGAYGFQVKADIDKWLPGEEAHKRNMKKRSPRFVREVRMSAGAIDPKGKPGRAEDER